MDSAEAEQQERDELRQAWILERLQEATDAIENAAFGLENYRDNNQRSIERDPFLCLEAVAQLNDAQHALLRIVTNLNGWYAAQSDLRLTRIE